MEISATLVLPSIPRTTPSSSSSTLSFASTKSAFFNNGRADLLKKSKINSGAASISTKRGFNCRCLFGLGVPEIVVIAGVAALVFGPKKLPEVGRSIGKTLKSFQQAAKEFESELKKEPDPAIESPAEEKPAAVSEEKKPETKVPSTKENL